jgi:hypothetical protein
MQGSPDNDTSDLRNAITDLFVKDYVSGDFPNSTIIFINSCRIAGANTFWQAFQNKNVATMVAWDQNVDSLVTEPSGEAFFGDLAKGMTVQAALDEMSNRQPSLTESPTFDGSNFVTAHLKIMGDTTNTLARAKNGDPIPPTATPVVPATATAVPTATPKPTAKPAKKPHCKKGYKAVKKNGKWKCVKK